MAKRRTLKREVRRICQSMAAECIVITLWGDEKKAEGAKPILRSVMLTEYDIVNRISHVEPGMKPKLYFNDVKRKFLKDINEIIDTINNL